MNEYLEIDNLTLTTKDGERTLVKNISYRLEKGKTLGIVGESGSGKTISAMSVVGLLPPSITKKEGKIRLHRENQIIEFTEGNSKTLRKARGKIVSVVFQEPLSSLNPSMKCGKQLEEIVKQHQKITSAQIKKLILSIMHQVDLPDPENVYKSYPYQLSGGQQQRVMIAMAVINNPDYIIADEPTTALDVLVQKKIIQLLKNLQEQFGMGIIFISHDIDLVASISDRIVVMKDGEIMEQGPALDIMVNPQTQYTKDLIACKPRPETQKTRLKSIDNKNNSEEKGIIKLPVDCTGDPLLRFKNVDLKYETGKNFMGTSRKYFHAVKNISFDVYQGETLGIVGGSGSGKSTIGKAIVRLVEESGGDIWYRGERLSGISSNLHKFRKMIQLVFQDPYSSLNPKIRIGEAIFEVLKVHGLCRNREEGMKKVIDLLTDVKMSSDYLYRYPHELSGGQRQRIVIARALAVEPELIICDESVSALDVSIQAEVLNLLNEIKAKRKLTMIFISHDLAVVKYMSQRIIVLKDGEIQEIADSEDLFSKPKSTYSRQLLDAMVVFQPRD